MLSISNNPHWSEILVEERLYENIITMHTNELPLCTPTIEFYKQDYYAEVEIHRSSNNAMLGQNLDKWKRPGVS